MDTDHKATIRDVVDQLMIADELYESIMALLVSIPCEGLTSTSILVKNKNFRLFCASHAEFLPSTILAQCPSIGTVTSDDGRTLFFKTEPEQPARNKCVAVASEAFEKEAMALVSILQDFGGTMKMEDLVAVYVSANGSCNPLEGSQLSAFLNLILLGLPSFNVKTQGEDGAVTVSIGGATAAINKSVNPPASGDSEFSSLATMEQRLLRVLLGNGGCLKPRELKTVYEKQHGRLHVRAIERLGYTSFTALVRDLACIRGRVGADDVLRFEVDTQESGDVQIEDDSVGNASRISKPDENEIQIQDITTNTEGQGDQEVEMGGITPTEIICAETITTNIDDDTTAMEAKSASLPESSIDVPGLATIEQCLFRILLRSKGCSLGTRELKAAYDEKHGHLHQDDINKLGYVSFTALVNDFACIRGRLGEDNVFRFEPKFTRKGNAFVPPPKGASEQEIRIASAATTDAKTNADTDTRTGQADGAQEIEPHVSLSEIYERLTTIAGQQEGWMALTTLVVKYEALYGSVSKKVTKPLGFKNFSKMVKNHPFLQCQNMKDGQHFRIKYSAMSRSQIHKAHASIFAKTPEFQLILVIMQDEPENGVSLERIKKTDPAVYNSLCGHKVARLAGLEALDCSQVLRWCPGIAHETVFFLASS